MVEVICAIVAAIATIVVAIIETRNRKQFKLSEERAEKRAKESRLAMDLMYATCSLSLTTAKKLANMHTNGDVEEAMDAARNAQDAYQAFVRDETARMVSR